MEPVNQAVNHPPGSVQTVDYHTAGEPLRIVTGGLPLLEGETMLAKRRHMAEHHDHWRRLLMREPRGHADMYGAVLTEPVSDDGDTGVLFLHNEGYSTMCGHGIIALVHAGVEQGLFPIADPAEIRFDTPAGRVTAKAHFDKQGKVASASFRNVPSFILEPEFSVRLDGKTVDTTIAFGGAFYAYVDARPHQLSLVPDEAQRIIELGRRIKQKVAMHCDIIHPDGGEDLDFLYGTIFYLPGAGRLEQKNVCVFADGQLDRSPTGTGVSGWSAIRCLRGEVELGEQLTIESIIGTRFTCRCLEKTLVGGQSAVITEVAGSASRTGEHRFFLDPNDPLQQGFNLR